MEERLRQLHYAHRAGTNNGSMRYLPFHEVDHPPSLPPFRPPPPRPPVPLEPWDHQAILAYRNRVNANSNPDRRNLDLEQHETIFRDPHKNLILHRDRERERRSGLWVEEYHEEEEEEEAQLDRLRLSRLRDGETRRNHHHQHQEFRDWSLRQQEPHPQLFVNQHQRQHQIHVSGQSNPTPALDQKLFRLGLEKRVRQDEEDELEEFQRRKRPKYQGFGIGNDTPFPYSPPRVQLPWQSAQVRGRVNHDSFEVDELTPSRLSVGGDRDSHLPRFREVQNSIGLNQHNHHHNGYTPIRVVDEDKEQMQRGSGFPKHLVEHRQASQSLELFGKDQLLPSFSPVSKGMGLQQKQHWEARKGKQKVQSKGKNEGIVNKQKNKIPQWVGKTNGKLRKSGLQLHSDSYSHGLPIAGLALSTQGKTASQNELLEPSSQEQSNISESGKWSKLDSAKYERSADTLDLSVVFKPSGMIAQEVVTSADNNWPDCTRTNSSGSKGLIQDHSFLEEDVEEEGEIRSVESEATLFQNKSLEDNHNAGSRSKPMSTTPISETVSSEEPSCYLDDFDNKAKRRSAMQSLEKVATLEKHPSLDRKDNDSPTTVKPNQSEEGPATAEYLGACTPSLMLDNNLCVSAPFELKLSSGEMQEVCSQDAYLTPSNCKIIDASDLEEMQKNKLKANQLEKPSLNDSEKMGSRLLTSSELHSSTEVIEQQWPDTKGQHLPNRTLRSNATQQLSGSYQIQNLQPDTTSSVKSIGVSTLPHSRQSVGSIPNKASSGSAARSRTWHRTDNVTSSSVLVRPFVFHNGPTSAGQAGSKVESTHPAAYVRKGNSLVRAPFSIKSSLAGPLNTTSKASTQIALSLKRVPARRDSNNVIIGNVGSNSTSITTAFRFSTPAVERPSTPPIAQTCKSSVCITGSLNTYVPADVSGTSTAVVVTTSAPSGNDCKANTKNISMDNQVMGDPSNSLPQSKTNLNEDSLETAGTVQMIYVKRKSNQLVAAPTSKSKSSTASLGEGGLLPSDCFVQDHYYKRKKNQLVRSSLSMDNKIPKGLEFPGVSSSVNMELNVPTLKGQRGMAFFRTKLGRVLKQKKHSTLQSKWVWTHGKVESSSLPFLQSRRVAPLFPWKRPSYGSSGLVGKLKAIPSISKRAPFSLISKKLNRLRKRDTVYTKSLNGYSLRRSGVLSLGGSNLKWTKSIEKRSKQANEEATIAVAAAEKRKREAQDSKGKEEKWTSKQARGIKLRGSKSRETSAEDSFSSFNTLLGSRPIDSAKLSSQRRVSIGDNDYLKVGNGNKLVRDPKKVCRVLASEKVRWSLHTARHRLAKRQQYCQFFTRFGKCNKEDGKCPYIHDREKVAVCTKFLKGACSNDKCELTHKIIPERMEDCSYFLQGLCTNENCPYRHVNVNPKAAVCDGFLKGYCAEGDKCNKKHTYICPQYAAMGECPERSNCKLHHPKKKDKPKASKRCKGGINVKRRYFVQEDFSISELASTLFRLHSELHPKQQINLEEPSKVPECLEFISLDTPEEDTNDNALIHGDISSMKLTKSEFLSNLGLPADDIDMMIKPVRLLWKDQAVNSTLD